MRFRFEDRVLDFLWRVVCRDDPEVIFPLSGKSVTNTHPASALPEFEYTM